MIHVHLEILTANTLSEVALVPSAPTSLNGGVPAIGLGAGPAAENLAVQCFDKDKQAWSLEVYIFLVDKLVGVKHFFILPISAYCAKLAFFVALLVNVKADPL